MSQARAPRSAAGRRPHPAVAERRREIARERSRRRRAGMMLLLGTAAAVALVYWLATGPLLAVHDVRVRGYDRDDRGALVAALTTAAGKGTILSPSGAEMRDAADDFPWVASIGIARTWPRGLKVDVVEATPAAVAAFGDTAVLVSADGRILGPREGSPGVGWMLLSEEPPAPGGTLSGPERAALTFIAAAPPELSRRIRAVRAGRDGALVARLTGGPPLRLGPPERLAAKARSLALVLGDLTRDEERAASYIDLTFPERPAIGPSA